MIDFVLADAPKMGDAPERERKAAEDAAMISDMAERAARVGLSSIELAWYCYMQREGAKKLAAQRAAGTDPQRREHLDEYAAELGLIVTYELSPEIAAKLSLAAA